MAIIVGITGGIGSGKSTVCSVFKLLGIPVFEADAIAKHLYETNSKIKSGLIEMFGEGIYSEGGKLNRSKLAKIIFNSNVQLQKVNALVHPLVRSEFEKWKKTQNAPYLIYEAAILFESGFYKLVDFPVLVSAPEKIRIERVKKRDNSSIPNIKKRMDKQWSDNKKRKLATIEIINDNKTLVIPQIIKIDNQLKEYGKIW